jgi:hypothetical protein
MTCVTHVGNFVSYSGGATELWRFDTSTLGWERVVNTTANGVGPSGRNSHVMTSIGLHLWLYGGYADRVYGESDVCFAHTTWRLLRF